MCDCFVVVSGSLSGFSHSQQESRCRPPLVDTDFESVGWGGGAMEPGTLRTQSWHFFCVLRHSVIKFRPCVFFMCSLAFLRRPLSIHETCVHTHVEENLSDAKSEHVFCSSQILVKRVFLIRSRNQSEIWSIYHAYCRSQKVEGNQTMFGE